MQIAWTLIVGLVAGLIARMLMPGRDPGGTLVTIALGMAGALIAGLAGDAIGWYGVGEGPGIAASVVGAAALLASYRAVR